MTSNQYNVNTAAMIIRSYRDQHALLSVNFIAYAVSNEGMKEYFLFPFRNTRQSSRCHKHFDFLEDTQV